MDIIRQVKIRIYQRLVRRFGERRVVRHLGLTRLIGAVDRRAREGRK